MNAVLTVGIIAFLLCLALTPLCRNIFLKYEIVDKPDKERKFHLRPIPRIGGLPIMLSYAAALGTMLLLAPRGATISIQHQRLFLSLLPAAVLIFLVGLYDDIRGLSAKQKLLGQLAAACLAVGLGARMSVFGSVPHSAWITIPLSVVWLVGCTNAFNLIDGLDGLASGVGLFATLTTLLAALATGNMGLAVATVPLVGCLLAFLRYNFKNASIFLGDCGSLTLGFMLGCFGLVWSQRSGTMVGMAAPLMAMALPLVDVSLSISRRFMRSAPSFGADRGHIHHMVLARGFKPHVATLILYGVSATAAALALLQTFMTREFRSVILILFCVLVGAGINYLGYTEISAAKQTLSHKTVMRVLKEEIYLKELQQSIAKANTIDAIWKVVHQTCEDLCFASVDLLLLGQTYEAIFDDSDAEPSWKMTLLVGRHGYLSLTRTDEVAPPRLMVSVLSILQESLREKHFITAAAIAQASPEERVVSQVA